MSDLVKNAEALKEKFMEAAEATNSDATKEKVENLRVEWLGRKGHVTKLFEQMKDVPKEDRPEAGKALNVLRGSVEGKISELQKAAAEKALEDKLNQEPIDITLPVTDHNSAASLHPVTLMTRILLKEFRHHGFTVYDGP